MKQIIPSIKGRTTKIVLYVYAIWFSLNLYALVWGMIHPNKVGIGMGLQIGGYSNYSIANIAFYPFESTELGTYDGTEFVMYTIVIPMIVFALYKIYNLVTNHPK